MSRPSRTLRTPVLLVATGLALAACAGNGSAGDDAADVATSQSAGPTATDTPSAGAGDVALPDGVLALPVLGSGGEEPVLDAGRYQVPLSDALAFDVDLPQGTTAHDEGLYLDMPAGIIKVEAAGKGYGVPVDACHVQGIKPVGPTVQHLVTAIGKEPVYRVSAPEQVKIGGAGGTYLEIQVPTGYDASSCEGGQVGMPGNPDTRNNMPPGYVGDWWVLDVDGQRVVAQTFCDGCGRSAGDALTKAVQSITFTSTP